MIAKKFTVKAKNGEKWSDISSFQVGHSFSLIDLEDDDELPCIEKEHDQFYIDGNHEIPFIQFYHTKEEFGLMESLLDFHNSDFQEFSYIIKHDCKINGWYDVYMTYPFEFELNDAKDDFEIESIKFELNNELNLYTASNKCTAKNQDMINNLFRIKKSFEEKYEQGIL